MKKILVLMLAGLVFGSLSLAYAGKYESVKTDDERQAEMRAKNLSFLKRTIGKQFYAQPQSIFPDGSPRGRVLYPEFWETSSEKGRRFRVLERDEFTIKEFIVGGVETSNRAGDTWYRRRVIFKIQFKSGKIGFTDLDGLVDSGYGGYLSIYSGRPNPNSLIEPKSGDPELDGALKKIADWELFRSMVW